MPENDVTSLCFLEIILFCLIFEAALMRFYLTLYQMSNLKELLHNSAVRLSSRERFSIFQQVALVLQAATLMFFNDQSHHSQQPRYQPQRAAILKENAPCLATGLWTYYSTHQLKKINIFYVLYFAEVSGALNRAKTRANAGLHQQARSMIAKE